MTITKGILEQYEERLQELLRRVGTVDTASARFQSVLADCAKCTAGLEREVQRLAKAPGEERAAARATLRRLAALNALVKDAVRREQAEVAGMIAQTRLVQATLANADQPVETGDSCDVRG